MRNEKKSMSRRDFIKSSVIGATVLASTSSVKLPASEAKVSPLRLGGPVFEKFDGPDAWVKVLKGLGYRTAYCPVDAKEKDDVINAYAKAAKKADIIISEVGAWSNPISADDKTRREALKKCREQLALADRIGANCCVNISGSRNEKNWAGPHKDNLTDETFDMIVETTRAIIDDVKPTRTYFALEPMPWSYPDSPDSYVRLIKAIDRERFAVHLDPVNFVSSPQLYFNNTELIKECFEKLGPFIKSCHAKDIILREDIYTPHLDELRPGLGALDYAAFLKELSKIPDTPLMMEHLPDAKQYRLAAEHIRSVAKKIGLSFG
ncbi:MAG: sugar phosphate isomerase/epimerase family protein [Planctomycetota bacterium]|jgi:sugar phosphate isomerase/epimerase